MRKLLIFFNSFLDIFEQKESVKAHKWLYSKHKVNQNQPPAILAWDTVEEILREKLSENYRQVSSWIPLLFVVVFRVLLTLAFHERFYGIK